ncbi:sortase domain-bontaining protein [Chloroflexota bacterium]
MNRLLPLLSKGFLILGGLLILAGVGWGIWTRINAPEPPVITDAGAVVFAMTAPLEPTTVPTETASPTAPPTATPEPTSSPAAKGPTPDLLPEWTVTQPPQEPTESPSTPVPATSTPEPTPTSFPKAENPPTRIIAPAIEMDVKVLPMGWEVVDRKGTFISEWVVPEKAAGWHMNSALPGHEENVVLSGHHNIEGKVFRHVVDLTMGDEITLYVDDTPYTYTVSEKYILKEAGMPLRVRRKNAQWIMPTGDERLTLVTCWPYEWPGNTHRVIVVARPQGYAGPREQYLR